MNHPTKTIRRTLLSVFIMASIGSLHAQYTTGFESPTYTSGSTINGVDGWANSFGTAGTKLASTANPYAGSQHLRLADTNASSAESIVNNLGSGVISLTNSFTVNFAFAVSGVSDGTGSQAQILFGTANTTVGTNPYWFSVNYDDSTTDGNANGNLIIWTNTVSGASTQAVNLGAFTNYSPIGSYVDFSITIDPTTLKYTSVTITGTTSGLVDKTSTVLANASGTIPHLSSAASSIPYNLTVLTGTNDIISLDVDAFSITSSIPEPSTYAFLCGTAVLGFVAFRRRLRF